MGQALYRKYRPRKLTEIVGQEHVTTALSNALKKGSVSHAYLFTGPRGVGKTSIARILAHEINQLPYDEEKMHLDIIEIDAASNRRIDEIRDLRERVHTAPSSAKYKVYIIDEVHMLTKEAFNALLKTLEEPPAHVVFVLATTEAHKLPDTIVSRTQRFSFRPAETTALVEHLRGVAQSENIDITDDALALIAEHGGGSYRDSMSLLDQTRNSGDKVDIDAVRRSLGIAPEQVIHEIWQAIEQAEATKLVALLADLRGQGYQSGQLAKQVAAHLRSQIVQGTSALPNDELLATLKALLEVPVSHDTETALEIALLGLVLDTTPAPRRAPEPPRAPQKASAPLTPQKIAEVTPAPADPSPEPPPEISTEQPPAEITAELQPLSDELWGAILDAMKKRYNTLYGLLRMAEASFDGNTLTLSFSFAFHQKRLNEAKNKQAIIDIVKQISGQDVSVSCVVIDKNKAKPAAHPPKAPLDTISNIFGGAEVIE